MHWTENVVCQQKILHVLISFHYSVCSQFVSLNVIYFFLTFYEIYFILFWKASLYREPHKS